MFIYTSGGQDRTKSELSDLFPSSMADFWQVLIHPALGKLSLMSLMQIFPIFCYRPSMQAKLRSFFFFYQPPFVLFIPTTYLQEVLVDQIL